MKKNIFFIIAILILLPSNVLAENITTNANNIPLHTDINNSQVVQLIPNSTILDKTSANGEWYQVNYNGNIGWINRSYTVEGLAAKQAEEAKKREEEAKKQTQSVSSNVTVMGNYTNYKQAGMSWSKIPYSYGTIGSSGCGPTSVAICASGFGIKLNPGQLVQKWTGAKLYASYTSNGKLLNMIGLKQTKVSGATLLKHLATGKPAIGRCRKGYYTSGGHYIAIVGIRDNNGVTQVYISNPGSRSKTGWTAYSVLNSRGVFEFYIVDKK